MSHAIRVKPGKKVDLGAIDPNANGGLAREEGEARFAALATELGELQELLYAAQSTAVLVVLQGLDTSGKDGTIRHVFTHANPQGTRVVSFKVPTAEELSHDFLWRVHQAVPDRGTLAIFNRSHYEDLVVVRVKNLAPVDVWRPRFEQINAFERLLADNGTIILKFFLHISGEEQESRLLDREHEVATAWKLSVGDWVERKSWPAYMEAYEDALSKCSTKHAPWFVVPADRKWFRDMAVAETIVDALRPLRAGWMESLGAVGRERLAELSAFREQES